MKGHFFRLASMTIVFFYSHCFVSLTLAQGSGSRSNSLLSEAELRKLLIKLNDSTQELSLTDQERILEIHFRSKSQSHGLAIQAMRKHTGSFEALQWKLGVYEQHYDRVRSHQKRFQKLKKGVDFTTDVIDLFPSKNKVTELKRKAINKLKNPFFDALDQMTTHALDDGVTKLMKPEQTEEALRKFAELTLDDSSKPEVQEQRLKDAAQYLNTRALNNPNFKAMQVSDRISMVKALQTRIKDVVENHKVQIKQIGSKVDANEKEIQQTIKTVDWVVKKADELSAENIKLANEIQKIQQSSEKEMNKLSGLIHTNIKAIRENKNEITENRKRTEQNVFAIGVLKNHMYEQLPTKDKLAWVNSKFYPLPEHVRSAEMIRLKKATLMENRLAIADQVNGYLGKCGQILGFAGQLGLDPEFVKNGQEIVGKASQGVDVIKSIIRSDPLGAITGIGRMIFGGGPDIATIRHQQIMAEFKKVKTELRKVQQNQQAILHNLKVIDQKINALAELVVTNHIQVMEQLHDIESHVLWNQKLLLELLSRDLKIAREFLRIDDEATYAKKRAFFQVHPDWYNKAITGLFQYVGKDTDKPTTQLSSIFFLKTYTGDAHFKDSNELMELKAQISGYHNARNELMQAFKNQYPKGKYIDLTKAITALTYPSLTSAEIRSKFESQSQVQPSSTLAYDQFPNLLNISAVESYCNLVLKIVPYSVLVNEQDHNRSMYTEAKLLSPASYKNLTTKNRESLELLRRSLTLVNLAIAQQALLQGDLIGQSLAKNLNKPETLEHFKQNPVLLHNVVRCWLQMQAMRTQGTTLGYDFALSVNDPSFLQTFTASKYRFVKKDYMGKRRWFLSLDEKDARLQALLPTVEEFGKDVVILSGASQKLLVLRQRLWDAIASYEFKEGLTADDNKVLTSVIAEFE